MRNTIPRRLTDAQLGYLAGLIDGEGWVGITCRKRTWKTSGRPYYYRPVIVIGMKYPHCIEYVCGVLGLQVTTLKREGETYRVRIYPSTLRWLLPQLIPYLVLKRRHAELLLEFVTACRYKPSGYRRELSETELEHRDVLAAELKRLNAKGIVNPPPRYETLH